jgi:type II secretory pathway pseudopilin PulG
MRFHRHTRKRGFTLVEALVAAGLAAILGTAFVTLLATSTRVFSKTTTEAYSDMDAFVGMNRLARWVRDGRSASVSNGTLTVVFPAVDANGDYTDSAGNSGTVRLNSGRVQATLNGATVNYIRNATGFTASVSGSTVTLTVNVFNSTGVRDRTMTYTQRVVLRNVPS